MDIKVGIFLFIKVIKVVFVFPCIKAGISYPHLHHSPNSYLHPMRFIVLISLLWSLQTSAQSQWYEGNTHTHSYWSDGDDFPDMIMDWYKKHGYDFIAL